MKYANCSNDRGTAWRCAVRRLFAFAAFAAAAGTAETVQAISIVSSKSAANGECTSVRVAPENTFGFANRLYLAWGAADGGGELSNWEHQKMVAENVPASTECLKVAIPAGAAYARVFQVLTPPAVALKGDGNAYVDTGLKTCYTDKMKVVFRVPQGAKGGGIAGSRSGSVDANFVIGADRGIVLADYNSKPTASTNWEAYRFQPAYSVDVWYKGEVSAECRRLTNLQTQSAVENDTFCPDTFESVKNCRLFDVDAEKAVWTEKFDGEIAWFAITREGRDILLYVPALVDGEYRLVDLVSGEPVEVSGGTLTPVEAQVVDDVIRSTETFFTGPDERGSGRSVSVVKTIRDGGGKAMAHKLAFGDGADAGPLLLFRVFGRVSQGADITAWDGFEFLRVVQPDDAVCECPLPEGWGSGVSVVRYFLAEDGMAARGDGTAYVDTEFKLKSGDRMSAVILNDSRETNGGVCGSRDNATAKNMAVLLAGSGSVTMDYNNGEYKPYRLDNVPYLLGKWYRAEVSATARTLVDLQTGAEQSNPADASAYTFESTKNCLLFDVNGYAGLTKFMGKIASFKVERGGALVVDMVACADGNGVGCFFDRARPVAGPNGDGFFYSADAKHPLTLESGYIDDFVSSSQTVCATAGQGLALLLK